MIAYGLLTRLLKGLRVGRASLQRFQSRVNSRDPLTNGELDAAKLENGGDLQVSRKNSLTPKSA